MTLPAEPRGAGPGLSKLGLGAWAFGGVGWGSQDDEESVAAVHRAVELGVTWIDTAAVYGDGHAERIVGRALAGLSPEERPLVFTKAGVLVDRASGQTHRDLAPRSLRAECEASLARLGLERIDLLQLHWPVDDQGIVEDAWETLGELRSEGKIRWAGVSNFDVPLLDACASLRSIDAMQVPLSLLSRDSCQELLPWAARHGVRTLTYSPLESGLLSGHFTLHRLDTLPSSDWRSRRANFQQPLLDRTLALVERLKPLAEDRGISLVELAIAWALSWTDLGGVIVGARSSAQVDGWASASSVTLDTGALDAIETALVETGAGRGPTRPPRKA
jgi:aryl-alcohol dehydrogenase-like predicted oxidoreductase